MLLFALLPANIASAAYAPGFTWSLSSASGSWNFTSASGGTATVAPGGEITITLSLNNYTSSSDGIIGIEIDIPIDSAVFEYVDKSANSLADTSAATDGGSAYCNYNSVDGIIKFMYYASVNSASVKSADSSLATTNSKLFEFTLKAKSGVANGTTAKLVAEGYAADYSLVTKSGSTASGVSIDTPTITIQTTYTITYDANGGTGAPASQTKTYGTALTLSSTKPTRSGYEFLGWSTSSSATTAAYTAGGSYTANASATLYAVWSKTSADYKLGDVNDDGYVTNVDLTILRQHFAGSEAATAIVNAHIKAADINGDGYMTNVDLTILRQYFAGSEAAIKMIDG